MGTRSKKAQDHESRTKNNQSIMKIIPLGGAGEVGKNAAVFEYDNNMFLVDSGVMFPSDEMLGIDLVIPDITYLLENIDRLKAIILTHGHEDHIGALPYFLMQIGRTIPIYSSDLTLGMVDVKLKEHKVQHFAELHPIEVKKEYEIDNISFEFFPVSHSVPASTGVAFHTPDGAVIFTGDFKFDKTPVQGLPTDVERLRELGDEGVLALISDCVRIEQPGRTPSEQVVGKVLEEIIGKAEGRVIITSFASNITRLLVATRIAHRFGRKVAVIGRSLEENLKVAQIHGYFDVPEGVLIPVDKARSYPNDKLVLLTTGSQGEPTSALSRIAVGDHPHIKLTQGDTVIMSANPVPGNEETVSRTIDNLFRRGAKVIYEAVAGNVHVSGHASYDELVEMLELTRPKYAIPLHGEYRHMVLYSEMAQEHGIPPSNILLAEVGDVLELTPDYCRKNGRVPTGSVLVDGLSVGGVTQVLLRDRKKLAVEGILIAAVAVDKETGGLLGGPDLVSKGLVHPLEGALLDEARERVEKALRKTPSGQVEYGFVVAKIKEVLGKFVYQETRQRPMILPVVTEI